MFINRSLSPLSSLSGIATHTALALTFLCVCSFFSVQMIKHLRTAEFKPFVVFVKPPSIERLRETRENAKIISGKDDKGSARLFTVREGGLDLIQ